LRDIDRLVLEERIVLEVDGVLGSPQGNGSRISDD